MKFILEKGLEQMEKEHSRVCAKINLNHVLQNIQSIHQNLKKDVKIMAVVKADGYGHGAIPIAKELESLDYLYGYAVATAEEALILRKSGIQKPILILGYIFPEQYETMINANISLSVFTLEMAQELSKIAHHFNQMCQIHFVIDTGMGRIGYQVTEQSADEIAHIVQLPHIIVEGIFTHFAKADETDKTFTEEQLKKFEKMIEMLEQRNIKIPIKHCSNSAGIIDMPKANMDIVRAGIVLYGILPSDEVQKNVLHLKPVMELKSHVAYVKNVKAGCPISYGGTFVTQKDSRIATIPVGYADGYCRGLSNKGSVLIHGKRAGICGRVCMDQFMVDVTDIPNVKIGDEVTLIGTDGKEEITMEELGSLSKRFPYEFTCMIGKRVPRSHYKDGKQLETQHFFF